MVWAKAKPGQRWLDSWKAEGFHKTGSGANESPPTLVVVGPWRRVRPFVSSDLSPQPAPDSIPAFYVVIAETLRHAPNLLPHVIIIEQLRGRGPLLQ